MEQILAKEAFLRQLKADGIDVIFGNPGTTEESLLDAIGHFDGIKYTLGLQEASVVAMADGWARLKRKPAAVQLHSSVGLGNALGILYEASRSHTPMVVFAGETYSDLQAFDGFLAGDLAAIARPVTKWSTRITHGMQLLRELRRAIKVAAAPPQGPVFLALPMDVLDTMVDAEIHPTSFIPRLGPCSDEAARKIAKHLVSAKWPTLLIGDGVSVSNAQAELRTLANLLACPTWGVEFNELSASFRDPMFLGLTGHSFGDNTRALLKNADAVLAIGTPLFPELFPSRLPYFQPDSVLMQIDTDSWEIAKNFPVEVAAQADPKESLARILAAVKRVIPANQQEIAARRKAVRKLKRENRQRETDQYKSVPDTPANMSPGTCMQVLAEEVSNKALIYDESITSTAPLLHFLQPGKPQSYILARGGCIGVGWPGAIGASFALPDLKIVAPSGDGSALYALQSLWTAVAHNRNVIFVVCNNESYRILKINLLHYWHDTNLPKGPFPFMDLRSPDIDFCMVARSFGMAATKVNSASALRKYLRAALVQNGPTLIEAMINGSVDTEIKSLMKTS